jgi:hypothetical protein
MKFGYADPPYYKQGKRLYGSLHPEADIWDTKEAHLQLIDRLHDEFPDGWAMSCNPSQLEWLLPHSPGLRVCVWAKTFHQIRPLTSIQYAWEPLLLHGGRQVKNRKPMVRDWLAAARAMRKGLIGAKPDAFNVWVLDLLAFDPEQDTITELFVGTNGMQKILKTYEKI